MPVLARSRVWLGMPVYDAAIADRYRTAVVPQDMGDLVGRNVNLMDRCGTSGHYHVVGSCGGDREPVQRGLELLDREQDVPTARGCHALGEDIDSERSGDRDAEPLEQLPVLPTGQGASASSGLLRRRRGPRAVFCSRSSNRSTYSYASNALSGLRSPARRPTRAAVGFFSTSSTRRRSRSRFSIASMIGATSSRSPKKCRADPCSGRTGDSPVPWCWSGLRAGQHGHAPPVGWRQRSVHRRSERLAELQDRHCRQRDSARRGNACLPRQMRRVAAGAELVDSIRADAGNHQQQFRRAGHLARPPAVATSTAPYPSPAAGAVSPGAARPCRRCAQT